MNVLSFGLFFVKYNIEIKNMSNIDTINIGEQICLTPMEFIMRDDEPETSEDKDHKTIVKLDPNQGTHWVLVISKDRLGEYIF